MNQLMAARGWRAAWSSLAVYPTASFLLAPFTEALFLALTLGVFAAANGRRWLLAGVLGSLASLTRGPGLLTAAALAWVVRRQRQEPSETAPLQIARRLLVAAGLMLPIGGVLSQYFRLEVVDPLRGLAYALIQFVQAHARDWSSRQRQQVRSAIVLASRLALLLLGGGYSLWWFIG